MLTETEKKKHESRICNTSYEIQPAESASKACFFPEWFSCQNGPTKSVGDIFEAYARMKRTSFENAPRRVSAGYSLIASRAKTVYFVRCMGIVTAAQRCASDVVTRKALLLALHTRNQVPREASAMKLQTLSFVLSCTLS